MSIVCPECNRNVKVKQAWRYNRTWFYIHCKCGRHRKSQQCWRGESTDGLKEKLILDWNTITVKASDTYIVSTS